MKTKIHFHNRKNRIPEKIKKLEKEKKTKNQLNPRIWSADLATMTPPLMIMNPESPTLAETSWPPFKWLAHSVVLPIIFCEFAPERAFAKNDKFKLI